jgi:DNA repair exonuclease SbcCD nuclease subunit
MGHTIIPGVTDSHWSDRRPASRTDPDWVATQSRKIEWVIQQALEMQAAALVHGGDVFNQPKGPLINRSVDQWLMGKLRSAHCPIFSIPGNHDMFGHNLASLLNHPYGCLEQAGIITSVVWPKYALVGIDPIVLITGKEYCPDGPTEWLESLRDEETLIQWKKEIAQEYGVPVFVLALSHGFWGPENGWHFGESVTSYCEVCDTGIDVVLVGHDHACKGIQVVEGEAGIQWVIEPGALLRGTIAEKDVGREPKMVVMDFESSGHHNFQLVSVPHEAPERVFNFENQKKDKKREEIQNMFIEACRKLQTSGTTIEVILSSIESEGTISSRVAGLTKEYLLRAEDQDS